MVAIFCLKLLLLVIANDALQGLSWQRRFCVKSFFITEFLITTLKAVLSRQGKNFLALPLSPTTKRHASTRVKTVVDE